MLVDLSFPLEAGGQQELPVVYGDGWEGPWCLDVDLLEVDKLTFLGIPAVDLGERVVAAQDGVLPAAHRERLEHHGAARRHGLQLPEEGAVPVHHLGVANEARQADEELRLDLEVLHGVHVLHLGDVGAPVKQLGGLVPLVDDWPLGAAGQNKVGLGGDFHVLHIGVPVPRVERLVGVEAIAVPFVDGGGAGLGTVRYDEEGLAVDAERLHIVWFTDFEDVDALQLDEFVGRGVALVDVWAAEQLSHNDEELLVDDQRFADYCGGTWKGNSNEAEQLSFIIPSQKTGTDLVPSCWSF